MKRAGDSEDPGEAARCASDVDDGIADGKLGARAMCAGPGKVDVVVGHVGVGPVDARLFAIIAGVVLPAGPDLDVVGAFVC